ncbi:DUF2252 domain-containing protein [Microbacterium sp. X-17]|uniref:DUF2252 domain-containing protein n=1 Tax=Microbacterium sp. X-17 TaxID=3144404 RepID=UPI0031F4A52E
MPVDEATEPEAIEPGPEAAASEPTSLAPDETEAEEADDAEPDPEESAAADEETQPVPIAVLDRVVTQELGRRRRQTVSRRALATAASGDRDPVAHLREQNETRLPQLVPLRLQRMLANPFTFYRGTAGLMALDLGRAPHSGILVPSCGDAHISNFGFFASPERRIVFDLNDFDEAAAAPWEWDVKRMLASAVIGGRHAGYAPEFIEEACLQGFQAYARALRELVADSAVDRYFMHLSSELAGRPLSKAGTKVQAAAIAAAERRTGERAVRRATVVGEDGRLRFVNEPPTMVRLAEAELTGNNASSQQIIAEAPNLYRAYRASVGLDIDLVLSQYVVRDVALRVVGVGSVGTRCFVLLLEGADGDALILQVKQAGPSVISQYGGIPQPRRLRRGLDESGDGFRVVGLQRVLQAVSDPFLGYFQANGRDFYVRQFHDMKGAIVLEGLAPTAFADYILACGIVLARAHAQSPTASEIVGYIGRSGVLGQAVLDWSMDYAERSKADFEAARAGFAGEYEPAP